VHLSIFFLDLTLESILEEIWYRSCGLHLIGAPICVFQKKKSLVTLGQSNFSSRPEPNNTQQVIPSWTEHSTTSSKKEDLVDMIQARLPSTWGLLMRMGTRGTMSPRLSRKEQGGLPRDSPLGLKARARGAITEAV
jgi:hypothetical protein